MEKIASFKINHLKLNVGLYVSRTDICENTVITTFDMRIIKPNFENVMDTKSIHAYEHLGATFLRNDSEFKNKIVYFGPMGCRTGFYLIVIGKYTSKQIFPLVKRMNDFVINYEGDVPGATPEDCGNYLDMDLEGTKKYANKYKKEFLDNPLENQFIYNS